MLPERTEKKEFGIPYLRKDGSVDTRTLRVYMPADVRTPAPAIFYAHYELAEDSLQLEMFLNRGWIVGMCVTAPGCNRDLVDDDLYFNNAAFVFLRAMDAVDKNKVIVYGGSAGGYMAMMLSILHLGICGTISYSGIFNQYFNTCCYMKSVHDLNMTAFSKLSGEEQQNHDTLVSVLPMRLQFDLQKWFGWFDADNQKDYVTLTPCRYTECFSNPVLFAHFTSDNLVPIDQVTHRYAYEESGESLPDGVKYRMTLCELPDGCDKPLEDLIPKEQTAYHCTFILGNHPDTSIVVPYSPDKKFNISVFDDGPVEAFGQHMKYEHGVTDFTGFIANCFEKGQIETASEEKLFMLIKTYAGTNPIICLPDQKTEAYGNGTALRKTVIEELRDYASFDGDLIGKLRRISDSHIELESAVNELIDAIMPLNG